MSLRCCLMPYVCGDGGMTGWACQSGGIGANSLLSSYIGYKLSYLLGVKIINKYLYMRWLTETEPKSILPSRIG